jgi:hypothetical protein
LQQEAQPWISAPRLRGGRLCAGMTGYGSFIRNWKNQRLLAFSKYF